jgi:hypothetical protein
MWWSVALASLGLCGLLLVGLRSSWGWIVGIADEALWIAYGVATGQWAFVVSAVAYGVVYARNLRAWRTDAPTEVRERMQ